MIATLLFVVVPYVSIAIFIGGHIWRYKYDKYGWTTRSSQLYERRLLRIGSSQPLPFTARAREPGARLPRASQRSRAKA